jgi:hypothetical protein
MRGTVTRTSPSVRQKLSRYGFTHLKPNTEPAMLSPPEKSKSVGPQNGSRRFYNQIECPAFGLKEPAKPPATKGSLCLAVVTVEEKAQG